MKPTEIDDILRKTLADRKLSRSEKQALDQVFEDLDLDDDGRAFWRHRAFAIARETSHHPDDRQVLEWLEAVVKKLQAPTAPSQSDVSIYFSPGDDCYRCITRLLDNARQSVDICVFTITDNRLAEAIERTHGRGVAVRIITDDEKAFDLGSDAHRLKSAGVPLRTDRSEHHMHHKFAVFDQDVALTGSYNWTRSAARHNRENLVATRDPRVIRQFKNHFEELWSEFDRS